MSAIHVHLLETFEAAERAHLSSLLADGIELTHGPDGSPQIALGELPGIGTEPDPELLKEFCLARTVL